MGSSINLNRNYNVNSNQFVLETDFKNLEKLFKINHPGFRITNTSFIYENLNENLESKLSLEAIGDAKRKAKSICDEIDKELGKILNIEVKEGYFSSNIREDKNENRYITYRVAITFQLIE